MTEKQIVAIGGGGFGRQDNDMKFEQYLLSLVKPKPSVLFLPQASKEDPNYINRFYETFTHLPAKPSHLSLFGRVKDNWQAQLLTQDIIYVGGGNTKSMMALWKAWGLDTLLKQAYEQGTVLCGVSAGAICWFEQGITDSVWPLGVVDGLGFLANSFCPHYDSEPERQQAYPEQLSNKRITPGYALEDYTAAHFINGKLKRIISTKADKKAFYIGNNEQTQITAEII